MQLSLKVRAGKDVKVNIRFKSPHVNNGGAIPVVDHINLSAGSVTGRISPTLPDGTTPNPAYSQINSDAQVIAGYSSSDWEVEEDGWRVIHCFLKVDKEMYCRIRGTNQSRLYGPLDRSNNNLDPRADPLGANTEAAAWADLWFYSTQFF
jgi:hypothetical protein